MGYAARLNHRRWEWLYRQPRWRRVVFALTVFRAAPRRRIFRGGFWRWVFRGGHPPQWTAVKSDHAMIRAAQREARDAARRARGGAQ